MEGDDGIELSDRFVAGFMYWTDDPSGCAFAPTPVSLSNSGCASSTGDGLIGKVLDDYNGEKTSTQKPYSHYWPVVVEQFIIYHIRMGVFNEFPPIAMD